MTLAVLIASDYLVSAVLAASATNAIIHVPILLITLGPLLLIMPMVLMMARAISEPIDSMGTNDAEPTPNECWKAGMIYYNRNDSALFVEKRAGLGYTFNFANRWFWVLASGLLLILSTAPMLI